MMVVNSFDLWQKDVFFSAAEEVQKSTDIMESAYRLWIREKKDEICKELQAALGTAKWQLEEFEKAVRLSHKRCGDNDSNTLTRHKQFVTAIENQILRVETSLQKNGIKESFRWIDLNEEERDDLAMFLSGGPEVGGYSYGNGSESVIDIEGVKLENADGRIIIGQVEKTAGTRRTWSSPNFSCLRIIIPGGDHDKEQQVVKEIKLVAEIEATPKVKGTKPLLWMQRVLPDHNQLFDKNGCFQNPIRLSFTHPIKLSVSLMLMVFLLCSHFHFSYI